MCGAFVNFWVGSSGENQNRVDDHLMGKLHLGYARLKVTVDKLGEEVRRVKELVDKDREENKQESVFERNARLAKAPLAIKDAAVKEDKKGSRSRSKSRSKKSESKSKRRSRSRSKDRRRSRSSDRRRRDRSRSRGGGGRRRSRSSERKRRDRSRDRRRSRDRKREGSRERRKRSSRSRS